MIYTANSIVFINGKACFPTMEVPIKPEYYLAGHRPEYTAYDNAKKQFLSSCIEAADQEWAKRLLRDKMLELHRWDSAEENHPYEVPEYRFEVKEVECLSDRLSYTYIKQVAVLIEEPKGLTEDEERERQRLILLQSDRSRWFSQNEFERLRFLDKKQYVNVGSLEEPKEESQEELWEIIRTQLRGYMSFSDSSDLIDYLKNRFTITRKAMK